MTEPFAGVMGQPRAVADLRAAARAPVHAYLLVGPAGVGKRLAARSFAACLVCALGGCGACRDCNLALAGTHPDVLTVERTGAYISVDEAREVTRLAGLTPVEGRRRVLILTDFHLVHQAAPALLKTIEEPPAATVFVILADQLVSELTTIASRCVTVEFRALGPARLTEILEAEGVPPEAASRAARVARGSLDRARSLVTDPGLDARQAAWGAVPRRLDGTGATVAIMVAELLSLVDAVVGPLQERQAAELQALAASAKARGERSVPARAALESRHRREQRRLRVDELRAGLAALGRAYADRLEPASPSAEVVAALGVIDQAGRDLDRNPTEDLLLAALFLRLSALASFSRA
ncbi:MAG: ATP-binding protein [Acidimicrobiales bacterium]